MAESDNLLGIKGQHHRAFIVYNIKVHFNSNFTDYFTMFFISVMSKSSLGTKFELC